MENRYTVSEFAKLRGVSVQYIYNQIKRGKLNSCKEVQNGKSITYIVASADGAKPDNKQVEFNSTKQVESDSLTRIEELKQTIDLLKSQIERKDSEIDRLMVLLDQQQRLSLDLQNKILKLEAPANSPEQEQPAPDPQPEQTQEPEHSAPVPEQATAVPGARSIWQRLFGRHK